MLEQCVVNDIGSASFILNIVSSVLSHLLLLIKSTV